MTIGKQKIKNKADEVRQSAGKWLDGGLGTLKYRMAVALAAGFLIALFLISELTSLQNLTGITYNPIVIIRAFAAKGFPLGRFLLLAVIAMGGLTYLMYQAWKSRLYEDPLGRNLSYSDSDAYGIQAFAKEEEYREIAPVRKLENCTGIVLGQFKGQDNEPGRRCLDYHPEAARMFNSHVFVCGISGVGKSTSIVKPYVYCLAKRRESIIVSDPKDEIQRDMAEYLRQQGYRILSFDTITPRKSDGWDPVQTLIRMGEDNIEQYVEIFARAIIDNINSEGIYGSAGKSLVQAILLYIILNPEITDKSMREFNRLISIADDKLYRAMFDKCSTGRLAPVKRAYDDFRTASPNLYGNVFVHVSSGVASLHTDKILDMLCVDDIDMARIGSEPTALFCRFSVTSSTYQFIIATFFSMLFEVLIAEAEKDRVSNRLKVPVWFILDEFANIGRLPDWERKMSTIRGYGMNAVMFLQDLQQMENAYPDKDQDIRANCGTWIFNGCNDERTAKVISDRCGLLTQDIRSRKENLIGFRSVRAESVNVGVGKRELISQSELQQMDADKMLVIFFRHKPILCNKMPIFDFPGAGPDKIPQTDVESKPDLSDREGRRKYREAEEKRIAEWNEAHKGDVMPEYNKKADIEQSPTELADKGYFAVMKYIFMELAEDIRRWKNRRRTAVPETEETESEEENPAVEPAEEEHAPVRGFTLDLSGEKEEEREEPDESPEEPAGREPEQPAAEEPPREEKKRETEHEEEDYRQEPSVAEEIRKCAMCGTKLTDAVYEYSLKNYGTQLCMPCQRKMNGSGPRRGGQQRTRSAARNNDPVMKI